MSFIIDGENVAWCLEHAASRFLPSFYVKGFGKSLLLCKAFSSSVFANKIVIIGSKFYFVAF